MKWLVDFSAITVGFVTATFGLCLIAGYAPPQWLSDGGLAGYLNAFCTGGAAVVAWHIFSNWGAQEHRKAQANLAKEVTRSSWKLVEQLGTARAPRYFKFFEGPEDILVVALGEETADRIRLVDKEIQALRGHLSEIRNVLSPQAALAVERLVKHARRFGRAARVCKAEQKMFEDGTIENLTEQGFKAIETLALYRENANVGERARQGQFNGHTAYLFREIELRVGPYMRFDRA